ncbi:MAG TPA: hypothetical protein VIN75_06380, partial [Burkholderiaceae bacterium]
MGAHAARDLVAVGAGHADVHHHRGRRRRLGARDRLQAVVRDLDVVAIELQHHRDGGRGIDVVVGDEDAHLRAGVRRDDRVGPPPRGNVAATRRDHRQRQPERR